MKDPAPLDLVMAQSVIQTTPRRKRRPVAWLYLIGLCLMVLGALWSWFT